MKLGDYFIHQQTGQRFICTGLSHQMGSELPPDSFIELQSEEQWTRRLEAAEVLPIEADEQQELANK